MTDIPDHAPPPDGLGPALARLGRSAPPELVEALGPAIERGHHLALLAGEGAGLGILYAAVALRDLEPAVEGVQALLLAPTPERSRRCAEAVEAICGPAGLHAFSWPPPAAAEGGPPPAAVVAGRPEEILVDVRAGTLALGEPRLVALDDVAALEESWAAVEAILAACGPETRKVAASHAMTATFERLVERGMPRARRWPAELWPVPGESGPPSRAASGGPLLRV
ncbi:MAG: hypothetical protein ACRELC_13785, partial [Gemmatimonadota bacterium]